MISMMNKHKLLKEFSDFIDGTNPDYIVVGAGRKEKKGYSTFFYGGGRTFSRADVYIILGELTRSALDAANPRSDARWASQPKKRKAKK